MGQLEPEIASQVLEIEERILSDQVLKGTFEVLGLERPMTSFTPTSQFKMGIYDAKVIANLQDDFTVLEVGVGEGALSEVLIKGFDVPSENITLADINLDNFKFENGCSKIEFNMLMNWPAELQKFNYITFPSSFGVATGWARFLETFSPLNDCVDFAETISKKLIHNSTQIDNDELNRFLKLVEEGAKDTLKKVIFVLDQAFTHLSDDGQIRLTKHGLNSYHQAYVLHKLRELGVSLKIHEATEDLLVLNKS